MHRKTYTVRENGPTDGGNSNARYQSTKPIPPTMEVNLPSSPTLCKVCCSQNSKLRKQVPKQTQRHLSIEGEIDEESVAISRICRGEFFKSDIEYLYDTGLIWYLLGGDSSINQANPKLPSTESEPSHTIIQLRSRKMEVRAVRCNPLITTHEVLAQ